MRRPLRQMLQHVVAGQVDQQRRDRYLASGNRVKVRARATVGLGAGGADPVNRAAARDGRLQRGLGAVAIAGAGHRKALPLLPWENRDLYVGGGCNGARLSLTLFEESERH